LIINRFCVKISSEFAYAKCLDETPTTDLKHIYYGLKPNNSLPNIGDMKVNYLAKNLYEILSLVDVDNDNRKI
jgi:hypothetical protein